MTLIFRDFVAICLLYLKSVNIKVVYGNPCQVAWSHLSGFIDVPTWCNSDRETLLQILDYFVTGKPYFSTGKHDGFDGSR